MKHRPQHIKAIQDTPSGRAAKARSRKWLKRGAWALAIYTVVGFLILPFIIRVVAVSQLGKELRREVTIEKVRLNPYTFSVTIRGLKIKDLDAETLLAWDEVYVNVQLASFLGRGWVFDEIAVINPYARLQVNKDYSLNFSDILAAHSGTNAPPKSAKPAKPVAANVRQLRVEGARVSVTDLTPSKPFRRIIGPVKISLSDFHTDPDSRNPHLFTGSTDSGETFSWSGDFSLDPLKAEGELAVGNVALKNFSALYEDFVNFEIRDGVADFHANYNFQLSQVAKIAAVSNVSLTLRWFKLGAAGAAENLIELPEFSVSGVTADLLARGAEVGSVAVRGAEFNLTRDRGAEFNAVAAVQANTNQSAPGGILMLMSSVTNIFAQLLNSTNLASATVRDIAVRDCAFTLRDNSLGRPVNLRVDQINSTTRNLSNRPDTNLVSSLSLRWNTNGTLKTELDVVLDPLRADLHLQLDRIELAPLSPYLDSFVNLYVLGSKVSQDGTIRIRTEPGQIPTVTFTGSTALDELNLVGGDTSEDLLKWSSLRFDGMAATLNPPAVSVTNITLKDVAARVVIETNSVINVLALVRTNAFGELTATNEAAATAVPADSGGSAIKRAFAQVKTLLGMDTNAFSTMPRVEVNAVTITNGELQFLDRSVTPPARLSLQKVNGTIANISTEEMRRAQVHFTTLVGGTGPIEITGQLNPLHAKQATEVKLSLKTVKLTPADPYTAKFLGYRLTRGELSVDVEYTISASQVKGRNFIVLDQLTLGSKVASPDAIKLPIKLGIALLKDSSGKIEIDVPVEGNLDDPQFRLGPVIWHVIGNVFVKAITSPFSLLGSLVGGGKGGEEMQFQQFPPGSTELDAAAREKLATLAKALEARPELEVEIEGNIHPDLDGAALRRAKMELQLRTGYWQSLRAAAREKTTPAQVELAPEVRADLLAKAYRDLLKTNPAIASVPVAANAAPEATPATSARPTRISSEVPKGATRMLAGNAASAPASSAAKPAASSATSAAPSRGQPTAEQMEQGLMSVFKISDAEFAALAGARARQVQTNLVQELKVAAERVLVSDPGPGAYLTNGNRVNLQLR